MSRLDHIAVAVRDVEQAASSLLRLHGLQAYAGGRTAGLGVQNYIIPVGDGYIELIGISDEREAAANPLGRAIIEKTRESDAGLLLWAVEPEEPLDSIAERLDLVISTLKRSLPDGGHCSFRLAGLQQIRRQKFQALSTLLTDANIISLIPPEGEGFGILELSGQSTRVDQWLGSASHSISVEVGEGPPALRGFSVLTESGHPIVFREPLTFIADAEGLEDRAQEEACRSPGKIPSAEHNADEPADGSSIPHPEYKGQTTGDASVFTSVLEQVEQALESAAVLVENVAGDIISPKASNVQPQN